MLIASLKDAKHDLLHKDVLSIWSGLWWKFSPVVRFESARLLLALAVQCHLKLHQMDVKTAFQTESLKKTFTWSNLRGILRKEESTWFANWKKFIWIEAESQMLEFHPGYFSKGDRLCSSNWRSLFAYGIRRWDVFNSSLRWRHCFSSKGQQKNGWYQAGTLKKISSKRYRSIALRTSWESESYRMRMLEGFGLDNNNTQRIS